VADASLEQALKTLTAHGQLVKDRGYRQVWRFEHLGRAYYLKFYPRAGSWWKRLVRGNPAMREFTRLQSLQKAGVPAPRAIASLVGFRIGESLGDAVIIEAIEPAVQLDLYLNDLDLRAEPIPDHLELSQQLRQLLHHLGRAQLGHSDLHLGNILLHEKKLYLLDGYAVRPGGLKLNDLLMLALSVGRFANRTDLQRGWELLGPGGRMPPLKNPVATRVWRKQVERATADNAYFGQVSAGEWSGYFFKRAKYPRRWSALSQRTFTREEWEKAFDSILDRIAAGQFEILKQSASGNVYRGEIVLGGRPIDVVIKHPRRKHWWRYVNEIVRGSRARRAWKKAWHLVARNIPTAWPLLMMEKRSMGYVTDNLLIFEAVPGQPLDAIDLDRLSPQDRETLFRRCGRILRRLDELRLSHFDPKSSNWIIHPDDKLGPFPVLVDVDGVRFYPWTAFGIRRLLRSMKHHPQYTVEDSKHLCQGYAPFAMLGVEDAETIE
jgi:tRNA A-37 threonylcarbamoyl transferase component Bud32